MLQALDASTARGSTDRPYAVAEADAALDLALNAAATSAEPLAVAVRALELSPLEFRILVLALAPELDLLFQRCIGFLLDDMGRRVGTTALYSRLLGVPTRVQRALAQGVLRRWLVFEDNAGRPPAADEPLRVDPFLAQWLLGGRSALAHDPRVRRALRIVPWPGAELLQRPHEHSDAMDLVRNVQGTSPPGWILLGGDPAAWRALLELGTDALGIAPIRVEPWRLVGLDAIQIEECARLVGRMTRLTGDPLVADLAHSDEAEGADACMRLFAAALGGTDCRAAAIGRDEGSLVRVLGPSRGELLHGDPLSGAARVEAMREAASRAEVQLTQELAEVVVDRYPLRVDGLEQAMRLARSRPAPGGGDDPLSRRSPESIPSPSTRNGRPIAI